MRQVNFSFYRWQQHMFREAEMVKSDFIESPEIAVIPVVFPCVFRRQGLFWKERTMQCEVLRSFFEYAVKYHEEKNSCGTDHAFEKLGRIVP